MAASCKRRFTPAALLRRTRRRRPPGRSRQSRRARIPSLAKTFKSRPHHNDAANIICQSKTPCSVRFSYFPHRCLAAFLAISDRCLAVIAAARALPPMRPSATAAAFLPSSVVMSSILPMAILPRCR